MTPEAQLQLYAAHQDQQAFAAVVAHYTPLVFGVALRRCDQVELAAEIAQDVFLICARKAGALLKTQTPLGPWLHRTTLLETMNHLRKAASARARLEALAAAPESPPVPDVATDPQWLQALPHLDSALDRLDESSRTAVLLRFYSDCSFSEIANRLGRSEDAARKLCSRAVSKLHRLLHRRGVSVPVALLTAGLVSNWASTQASASVPAGLATGISSEVARRVFPAAGPAASPGFLPAFRYAPFLVGSAALLVAGIPAMMVGKWLLVTGPHQQAQALLENHRTLFGKTKVASGSPPGHASGFSDNAAPEPGDGTFFQDLSFLGRALSDDPGVKAAYEADAGQLTQLSTLVGRDREPVDFLEILKRMGSLSESATEKVTEAGAALAFLTHLEKYRSILARFEEDLAVSHWKRPVERGLWGVMYLRGGVQSMLLKIPKIYQATARAKLLSGQAEAAWKDIRTLITLGQRLPEAYGGNGLNHEWNSLQHVSAGLRAGFTKEGWSDSQLTELVQKGFPGQAPFLQFKVAVAQDQANLEIEKAQRKQQGNETTLRSTLFSLRDSIGGGNGALEDAYAIRSASLERAIAQIGPDGGYVPPPAGSVDPEHALASQQNWFTRMFQQSICPLSPDPERLPSLVMDMEAQQDIIQIEASLELYRRHGGSFPENLSQLASHHPNGLPVSPVTGEAYLYERTATGYTISGPLVDPSNPVNGRGKELIVVKKDSKE